MILHHPNCSQFHRKGTFSAACKARATREARHRGKRISPCSLRRRRGRNRSCWPACGKRFALDRESRAAGLAGGHRKARATPLLEEERSLLFAGREEGSRAREIRPKGGGALRAPTK